MNTSAISVVLTMLALPVLAGETPWQDVAPDVRIRLISTGQVTPAGTAMLGLEIDMPETTKTYWRVPGETGIPPQLDFSASPGVLSYRIVWPYPTRLVTQDYMDYAYLGPTVLPLEVVLADGVDRIELNAVLGICSDICVPAQARFSLAMANTAPDRANGLRIRQALAEAPVRWNEGSPIASVQLVPESNLLAIRLTNTEIDPNSLIVATESGEPLFGMPQRNSEPGLVLIPILGENDGIDLENQDIQFTFLTNMGAFEIEGSISAPVLE